MKKIDPRQSHRTVLTPATSGKLAGQMPTSLLKPRPLMRELLAYILTRSELDSLGSVGTRLTFYLWASALGISFAASSKLAAVTVPSPWSATQTALFVYSFWGAVVWGILFSLLSGYEGWKRNVQIEQIKAEHRCFPRPKRPRFTLHQQPQRHPQRPQPRRGAIPQLRP